MSDALRLNFTHTRLLVADFAACFRFYRDVLGFRLHLGEESDQYAEFRMNHHMTIALFTDSLMGEALGRAVKPCNDCPQVVLCMHVDDVEATCETLKSRGVKFITPPTDRQDWGIRTAHFADPDGNIIEINQKL